MNTNKNIILKLRILTFMPIIIIGFIFLFMIADSVKTLNSLNLMKRDFLKINRISDYITELQKERGLSGGYISNKSEKLMNQIKVVRKDIDNLDEEFNKKELLSIRNKVNNLKISPTQELSLYTDLITKLHSKYLKVLKNINDPYIIKSFHIYYKLAMMKEALGEIRGSVNSILASKKSTNKKLLYYAVHAKGMYDVSMLEFKAIASKKYLAKFDSIKKNPNYKYMNNMLKKFTLPNNIVSKESPEVWFQKSTNVINKITKMQKEYILNIKRDIKKESHQIKLNMLCEFIFLIFIWIVVIWISHKIKNNIIRSLLLLAQYKDVVDRSSIVSKGNIKGIITYANDKFSEISGYSRAELIGKSHNIVRHSDVSPEVFKDLWTTILSKKPWHGIIKNRKKNGDYYIVDATINPILNQKGEIEEFIAMRYDITDVFKLQEDLENTQKELLFRMGKIEEFRSKETGFHVKRVAKYSELLGKLYGLEEKDLNYLVAASPMHDVGKIGIPDNILNKPAKLTGEDWKIMKTHTNIGYELFKDTDKPILKAAGIIAYEHHEKYNGSGYPRGLKGEEIHIFGRITALADVFDALGSDRCYKNKWSDEKIFKLFEEERGKYFDPKLVDLFFENLDEFLKIREEFSEQFQTN